MPVFLLIESEDIQEMEKAASKNGDHRRRNVGYFAYRSHDITRELLLVKYATTVHRYLFYLFFFSFL
jgi:hypothetical protein